MMDISFPYRVTEVLHKSDRITLYRAIRASDRAPSGSTPGRGAARLSAISDPRLGRRSPERKP